MNNTNTSDKVHNLKQQHLIEKFNLKALDTYVPYHINNPELIAQRNRVRALQDLIIQADSYDMFVDNYRPVCKFPASEYCDVILNHTYKDWCMYGNCCRECTKVINRHAHRVTEDKGNKIKTSFMIEMEVLEMKDMAEEDKLY
jgi:hypothetical protein